jgi:hypothetical protein
MRFAASIEMKADAERKQRLKEKRAASNEEAAQV